ncbi:hypothetical protein Hdeb2414_s0009g00301881 [Helianthus debilis subsp. tardiflorus]
MDDDDCIGRLKAFEEPLKAKKPFPKGMASFCSLESIPKKNTHTKIDGTMVVIRPWNCVFLMSSI